MSIKLNCHFARSGKVIRGLCDVTIFVRHEVVVKDFIFMRAGPKLRDNLLAEQKVENQCLRPPSQLRWLVFFNCLLKILSFDEDTLPFKHRFGRFLGLA